MNKNIIGKCGMYCGACDIYYATIHPDYQDKLAKHLGCEVNELSCKGCGQLTESCWGYNCGIANCCETHKVASCRECTRFPCDLLTDFAEDAPSHHHTVIENSIRIKDIGEDQWLEEQEKRWSCFHCSHPFRWYTTHCAYCGEAVYNCEDEDAERIIEE